MQAEKDKKSIIASRKMSAGYPELSISVLSEGKPSRKGLGRFYVKKLRGFLLHSQLAFKSSSFCGEILLLV
jgi:hypothetical protein